MNEEIDALLSQGTWDLVSREKESNLVGNKCVFKVKRNLDFKTNCYKTRLVAKEFHQCFCIDYFEMFSLVIKSFTIRLILSLIMSLGWTIK